MGGETRARYPPPRGSSSLGNLDALNYVADQDVEVFLLDGSREGLACSQELLLQLLVEPAAQHDATFTDFADLGCRDVLVVVFLHELEPDHFHEFFPLLEVARLQLIPVAHGDLYRFDAVFRVISF